VKLAIGHSRRAAGLAVIAVAPLLATACGGNGGAATPALRVGAIFPLAGTAKPLAEQEYLGVGIARDMVNAAGGVHGQPIALDLRDVESTGDVQSAVNSLRGDGARVVLGAYSSSLSIPTSAAVARDGMVYWETGAVADRVTGQGFPLVFRVGANGADLGGNSGRFVVTQIAPRLQRAPSSLRAFLVTADDAYAHSVGDAARVALTAGGVTVAGEAVYETYLPQWPAVIAAVRAAHPDVLILSSHIPDGIAFRRAFLAAGLHVDAFIGSTMAQCLPDFGDALGPDAVGVFASDRPEDDFNPSALAASARALFDRFAAEWHRRTGTAPTEEGIAGFSSAWPLFHDVLPAATGGSAQQIAAVARTLDMPEGSLPNGAGLLFSNAASQLGQNTRAAAVIWQWQAVRHSVVVWPPVYATGTVAMVPLPR
jgi:branched-chain amino acid transport system substrate-binding protein